MNTKTYALITGASSGIGAAVARKLAETNHNLILIARRKDKLHQIKEELEKKHEVEVLCFALDVTDIPRLNTLFKKLEDLSIDIAINNAGLALGKDSIEDYDWADFNTMIDVNVKAFTRVAQLIIPFLKKTKGHIINISSIAGIEAYEGGSVYCGTKAFVKMVSKSMRLDLAGTGVRVTDIAPGAVDTEFSTVRFKGDKLKADNVYQGFVPLYADDIADTILFALNRPPQVNIEYIMITPTAQAGATRIHRG
ncbi:MAG: SDR family NAD(P)-dependent oxidoreductase [Sphingobacteriia bacterium]|nr:SDR family NAD(P)-dependent oxidoreductase [Sphingobacteriia bacterium]